MKLSDAIKNLDRSESNTTTSIELDDISAAVGIPVYQYVDDTSLKYHFLKRWICTDSWVGIRVYFLDEEPLAVSTQTGRKSDEVFEFVSKEMVEKFREYLFQVQVKEGDIPNTRMVNLDQEIGDSYSVHYTSELLTRTGFVINDDGKKLPVEVVGSTHTDYNSPSSEWSRLTVKFEDGTEERINIDEFRIPYMLQSAEGVPSAEEAEKHRVQMALADLLVSHEWENWGAMVTLGKQKMKLKSHSMHTNGEVSFMYYPVFTDSEDNVEPVVSVTHEDGSPVKGTHRIVEERLYFKPEV
jgi:hypothetical protein